MEVDRWEEFEKEKKSMEANVGSTKDVLASEERYVSVRA